LLASLPVEAGIVATPGLGDTFTAGVLAML
jgi:hypothetical protein